MKRSPEQENNAKHGVSAVVDEIWQAGLKPFFQKVGRYFTSDKWKKIGSDILTGRINLISIFFCVTISVLWIVAFIFSFQHYGTPLKCFLFYNDLDYFWDFFHSMADSENPGLYTDFHVLYPPLVMAPLNMLFHLIPNYETLFDYAVRDNQVGMIIFVLVFTLIFSAFIAIMYKEKKGSHAEKIMFILGIMFSIGVIEIIDRGNEVIFAIVFSSLFLALYNSEKWWKREVSYVSLAIAVVIKIYPVFLGILLLRNKQWSGAIRTAVYWLVLFVTPFLYYGNMALSIKAYIEAVFGFGINGPSQDNTDAVEQAAQQIRIEFQRLIAFAEEAEEEGPLFDPLDGEVGFTFAGTFQILFVKLYRNYFTLDISKTLGNGLLVLCFLMSFFQNEDWKSATLLTIFSLTFTQSINNYCLPFLVMPCIMFLNKANFKNPLHWMYAILYLAIFGLVLTQNAVFQLVGNPNITPYFNMKLPNTMERFAILIMAFLLICEGVFHAILLLEDLIIFIIRKYKRNKLYKTGYHVKPVRK